MSRLQRLDDRLVPVLARRARSAAHRAQRARARVTHLRPSRPVRVAGGGAAPAVTRLRALDDRFTHRGPLGLLRELPQVGGLLLAILILVSGGAVLQRSEPRSELVAEEPTDAASAPDPGEVPGGLIGPEIGDNVPDYAGRADRRLQDRFVDDPDERSFAVISLERYLAPDEMAAVLRDVGGFRVFFRVPAKGLQTEVQETAVKRLVPDVLAAYQRVATQRRADIAPLLEMARTTDDPEFKSFYAATAKSYQTEVDMLSKRCACLFGAVTVASNSTLRSLRARDGVRLVDLGPRGATFDTLTYRALLPEEQVTVTGGNEAPSDAGIAGG
ncbi:MAG TPA: hypothetical protein VNA12_02230 [Mycobacteriales bacterium]|nr:hypothetical protein [Mycobacteriales bacterium]